MKPLPNKNRILNMITNIGAWESMEKHFVDCEDFAKAKEMRENKEAAIKKAQVLIDETIDIDYESLFGQGLIK